MKRLYLRFFIFAIIAGLTLIGFQNCAPSHQDTAGAAKALLISEFEYPYGSKPAHYIDALVLRKPAPNPSKSFYVHVSVGTPQGTPSTGTLTVKTTDDQNRLICPQEIFNLATDGKTMLIDCVPPFAFTKAKVTLTLTGTSGNFVSSRLYNFN